MSQQSLQIHVVVIIFTVIFGILCFFCSYKHKYRCELHTPTSTHTNMNIYNTHTHIHAHQKMHTETYIHTYIHAYKYKHTYIHKSIPNINIHTIIHADIHTCRHEHTNLFPYLPRTSQLLTVPVCPAILLHALDSYSESTLQYCCIQKEPSSFEHLQTELCDYL